MPACGAASPNRSAIDGQQSPRLLIGRASQHHAIDMSEMLLRFSDTADAAIDDDGHVRHCRLQPIDPVIIERRDVAVFLRRQSVEPGLAGMHDQRIGARRDDAARQFVERNLRILIVDADAAFDGDGNLHRALHRGDAFGNQLRLRHQAGAEAAILHAVGRAADIEVDLVIAEILADFGRGREIAADRSRQAAAPPDARWRRSRAAARDRHE